MDSNWKKQTNQSETSCCYMDVRWLYVKIFLLFFSLELDFKFVFLAKYSCFVQGYFFIADLQGKNLHSSWYFFIPSLPLVKQYVLWSCLLLCLIHYFPSSTALTLPCAPLHVPLFFPLTPSLPPVDVFAVSPYCFCPDATTMEIEKRLPATVLSTSQMQFHYIVCVAGFWDYQGYVTWVSFLGFFAFLNLFNFFFVIFPPCFFALLFSRLKYIIPVDQFTNGPACYCDDSLTQRSHNNIQSEAC